MISLFVDPTLKIEIPFMNEIIKIKTPLTDSTIESLHAGCQVEITGTIFTARDMAHKRLCDALDADQPLPIDLKGAVFYFLGPTPAKPSAVIGSAGPTTSSRMDPFSPKLIQAGLKGMIGKGYRNLVVRQALKQFKAVHFAAIGGAGALLSKHIKESRIIAYPDLGPEAIRKLHVVDFPAVVAYDCLGHSVYNVDKMIR